MPMSEILEIIGGNVRRGRVGKNLTQEALAEKADLHPNYIGMIERHQRNVSILALEKIAKALDVSVTDLLKGKRNG